MILIYKYIKHILSTLKTVGIKWLKLIVNNMQIHWKAMPKYTAVPVVFLIFSLSLFPIALAIITLFETCIVLILDLKNL